MTYIEASQRLGELQIRLAQGEHYASILKEMGEVLDKVIKFESTASVRNWREAQETYGSLNL